MATEARQFSPAENFSPPETETANSFNAADIFKGTETLNQKSPNTEPQSLEFTNPFPLTAKCDVSENTQLAQASDKPGEKPLRRSDLPEFKKFTPEEQEKVTTDLAKQIAEKGFTPAPELRDKIREGMLRAYMDGDRDGTGNQQALDKFVKQMSDKLPPGMSLKVDSSETNKDYMSFKERAQGAIDKQPGMKMGSSGQLQLCKTENGATKVVDKMHYAASIRKAPASQKA